MNPIVEKIGDRQKEWFQKADEFMNPFIQKLNVRRKDWFNKGSELWADFQDRHSDFFERSQTALDRGKAEFDKMQPKFEEAIEASQKAFTTFETNVLTKTSSILEWAFTATGEKSEVIRRTREFVEERLAEVAEADVEPTDEIEVAEAVEAIEEVVEEEVVEEEEEAVDEEILAAPFEDYDSLNVKKIIERLDGMDNDEVEMVLAYEKSNKGRKTIIDTVDRMLAE